MKIKAAVLRAADQPYRIEEVELAAPGPDQILVRIVATGFCHSDAIPRHTTRTGPLPLITGHEGAGVVEAVGADVSGVVVGDHVLLSYDSCGTCARCRADEPYFCVRFGELNLVGTPLPAPSAVDSSGQPVRSRWFGQSSFATHVIASARNFVVVDRSLPLDVLCPLGCGIQTGAGTVANIFRPKPGQSLIVFGVGGVGMAAIMAARALGGGTIIAVDLKENRLETAKRCGATHAFAANAADLAAQIAAVAPDGLDFGFDTTGRLDVLLQAMRAVRQGGMCAQVGGGDDLVIPASLLNGRLLTRVIEGNAVPQRFIPWLIDLWRQGKLPVELISRTYTLPEINAAEEASADGSVIKPIVLPA